MTTSVYHWKTDDEAVASSEALLREADGVRWSLRGRFPDLTFVYVFEARSERGSVYKVGLSYSPLQRSRGIYCCPVRADGQPLFHGAWALPNRDAALRFERSRHRELWRERIGGEWFAGPKVSRDAWMIWMWQQLLVAKGWDSYWERLSDVYGLDCQDVGGLHREAA